MQARLMCFSSTYAQTRRGLAGVNTFATTRLHNPAGDTGLRAAATQPLFFVAVVLSLPERRFHAPLVQHHHAVDMVCLHNVTPDARRAGAAVRVYDTALAATHRAVRASCRTPLEDNTATVLPALRVRWITLRWRSRCNRHYCLPAVQLRTTVSSRFACTPAARLALMTLTCGTAVC